MPALLMHIQAAEQLRQRRALPPPLQSSADEADWAYRLGSILVDLPLFEGFWLKVALFLIHRPYPESRWGAVIHARGAGSLAASLMSQARGALHQTELTALTAGLVTHISLDRAVHPLIEEAVRLHLRPSETHDQLHEALENYQCLDWHRRHVGVDGLGTALLRQGVRVGPGLSPQMPPWLSRAFRRALEATYGTAPDERELWRWTGGLCGYRDVLSTPLARLSIRSSERLARRRPWVTELETEASLSRGLALAVDTLERINAAELTEEGLTTAIGDGPLV